MSAEDVKVLIGVSLGANPDESAISIVYREERRSSAPFPFVRPNPGWGHKVLGPASRGDVETRAEVAVVFGVRHLERPKGGLLDVIRRVVALLLDNREHGDPYCLIDTRATGHAAYRQFWREIRNANEPSFTPVCREFLISNAEVMGGKTSNNAVVVSRTDLITDALLAFGLAQLRVAPTLSLAGELRRELGGFKRRPEPMDGSDPWRLGPSDDLVLATALPVHAAKRWLPEPRYRQIDFWENTPLAGG